MDLGPVAMRKPDVAGITKQLDQMGAKKILLQLPDGLKPEAFELFSKLSARYSVIISSDPFYGACDAGTVESYREVDCIVQLGHSPIPNLHYPKPIIFEEFLVDNNVEVDPSTFEVLRSRGYRRIGLLFSVQYKDVAEGIRNILLKTGFEPLIGPVDGRMKYPGQVLGCNFSAAHLISDDAECFLVVSTGKFHAIGVQLSTEKETFLLDLNSRSIESVSRETDEFLRMRYARISRALDAENFCIVMDTKIGQYREKLAYVVKEQVEGMGKNAIMLKTSEVRPSDYENLRCDAIVFTGCPRVSIDDEEKFKMPILTPPEFQRLFGFKKTRNYIMDEIVAVDQIN
jgi:2-(3-amino-3-carboxypropyl)histidine synthase